MVTIGDLARIESILVQANDLRACTDSVQKVRRLLAAGGAAPDVRRKLEQLVGRFGNARFAPRKPLTS